MSRNLNNGQFKQCCGQSPMVVEMDEPHMNADGELSPYWVICLECKRYVFAPTIGEAIDKWNGGQE